MASPYANSSKITGISFDFAGTVNAAPGSDEWAVCWADDDKLYTGWGDGGGFGGTNDDGRVYLGFAAISGSGASWSGHNIWGGKTPDTPAVFGGKASGILCISGVLYAWIQQDAPYWTRSKIVKSADHGLTWTYNPPAPSWPVYPGSTANSNYGWDFTLVDGLMADFAPITFGKDYSGARDGYVYGYTIENQTKINASQLCTAFNLARVPIARIQDPSRYRYYAGTNPCGTPIWSANIGDRVAVFTDPAGVSWGQRCWYHPVAKRYLLSFHRSGTSDWGIFDAPEPWGPWTTVAYYTDWNGTNDKFCFGFNEKWMNVAGTELYMIWSGDNTAGRTDDRFNVTKATLTLA